MTEARKSFAPDSVALQIQDRFRQIHALVHDIEDARLRSECSLENIEKIHEEINIEEELTSVDQRKLKFIYTRAMNDAQQEVELTRTALEKIDEIRNIINERRLQARKGGNKEAIRRGTLMKMLQVTAQTLPLYISKVPGEDPPPLCGAIPAKPSHIAKMGDMVAAFVKNSEEEENWILAEVISYNHTTTKYEIDDVDEEEKQKYVVSRRRVVPLPLMRANPETDPQALFPAGVTVMALYPQTTCFYKAKIHTEPATAKDDYQVLFEDETNAEGYSAPLKVPQRYIISNKEGKNRQKRSRLN